MLGLGSTAPMAPHRHQRLRVNIADATGRLIDLVSCRARSPSSRIIGAFIRRRCQGGPGIQSRRLGILPLFAFISGLYRPLHARIFNKRRG